MFSWFSGDHVSEINSWEAWDANSSRLLDSELSTFEEPQDTLSPGAGLGVIFGPGHTLPEPGEVYDDLSSNLVSTAVAEEFPDSSSKEFMKRFLTFLQELKPEDFDAALSQALIPEGPLEQPAPVSQLPNQSADVEMGTTLDCPSPSLSEFFSTPELLTLPDTKSTLPWGPWDRVEQSMKVSYGRSGWRMGE